MLGRQVLKQPQERQGPEGLPAGCWRDQQVEANYRNTIRFQDFLGDLFACVCLCKRHMTKVHFCSVPSADGAVVAVSTIKKLCVQPQYCLDLRMLSYSSLSLVKGL